MADQLELFRQGPEPDRPHEHVPFPGAPTPSGRIDVGCAQSHAPEWTTTGICCGSPTCLCGQGELSDNPLWNEAD